MFGKKNVIISLKNLSISLKALIFFMPWLELFPVAWTMAYTALKIKPLTIFVDKCMKKILVHSTEERFQIPLFKYNDQIRLDFGNVLFKIPGRNGLYYEKPNWIKKDYMGLYFDRNGSLKGLYFGKNRFIYIFFLQKINSSEGSFPYFLKKLEHFFKSFDFFHAMAGTFSSSLDHGIYIQCLVSI